MGLKDTFTNTGKMVVDELQRAAEPDARSVDNHPSRTDSRFTRTARRGTADKHFPNEKKLDRYWEIYQEVPIIRHPIRSFASEVVSPGYYVDTDNEELKEELEDWLSHSAIVDGEVGKDFSILLKKAQIQREVKGTSLCEKVSAEDGNLYGFKLMRPETVRAFTKPGQTVLLPPDYEPDDLEDESEGLMEQLIQKQDFYRNDEDEIAAYVQLDDVISDQSDDGYYIPFTRDEVIKLTRDADTGEIFGESRITAVEDRLNSLLKKLDDADKAIESTASPLQLFKFGVGEEGPWAPEEIAAFMNEHKQSEFEPGMKQGVQGDVTVEEYGGEVPNVGEFLEWDLNWIMSEMPMPKYALGGYTSDVNQFVSRSQSARLENQKKEARTEISNEWTPVLEEKAEEMGYDPDDVNALVIGEDPSDMGLEDVLRQDFSEEKGGVVFQGVVDEELLAKRIERGWLDVSPRIIHTSGEVDDRGVKHPKNIRRFDNLSLVSKGAAPSNEVTTGEAEELSAEEIQSCFEDEPEIESAEFEKFGELQSDIKYEDYLYNSPQGAEGASQQFGCEGYHKHDIDGETWYMPCENHDKFLANIKEKSVFP